MLEQRIQQQFFDNADLLSQTAESLSRPIAAAAQALLDAVPIPDPALEACRPHQPLGGEVPSPLAPPSGCVFHPRCPRATAECRTVVPPLREIKPRQYAACIRI